MKAPTWNDKLSTQIESMDAQHRQVFEYFAKLWNQLEAGASQEEVIRSIQEIVVLEANHCREEEALMKEHQFPGYHTHKREHQQLFMEMRREFIGPISRGEMKATAAVLKQIAKRLVDHIVNEDRKYGLYINSRQNVATPTK